ncbi:hypothetical protein [Streptomyces arboris]|uniref:Uncharacterized protein n=1 Tax=Streptomyces arboris TaxID=2600619 RepID=A0A5N5ERE7_9ACTN|nr:hypothetical protein [Streptomyces arboris]KAB2593397.1 hypothetical protein F5983_07270 [Streptomyces arboris]
MGEQSNGDAKDVHITNDVSGHVNGPVGQFGHVYGDVNMHAPHDEEQLTNAVTSGIRAAAEAEAARAAEEARRRQRSEQMRDFVPSFRTAALAAVSMAWMYLTWSLFINGDLFNGEAGVTTIALWIGASAVLGRHVRS